MAIAMKDLEIRGAGNLLGGEQSGHIADVGFDLYVRLVGEAVHEFRGDGAPPRSSARSGSSCRSTPTCRTTTSPASGCGWRCTSGWPRCAPTTTSTCSARSCVDRYGEPPVEVASLLLVARFRARARQAGIAEVTIAGQERPVRAGRPARLARRPAQPAVPAEHRQGPGRHDAGAAARTSAAVPGHADRRGGPA